MAQCGLERVGRAVTFLKRKAWRMGISVTSQDQDCSGIPPCSMCAYVACHRGVCVFVCVSVFTLSVSALQLISATTSAHGWVILSVPKCGSAAVGEVAFVATFPPSCQCCLQGLEQLEERRAGREGGRGFACSSPIHCHPTPGSLSPAHRHILLARSEDLIGTRHSRFPV